MPTTSSFALDHEAISFNQAGLGAPRRSLSGQKRLSSDGDAVPSSLPTANLPPSGRPRSERHRSATRAPPERAPSPAPADSSRRASRSPRGRERSPRGAGRRRSSSRRRAARVFPPLKLLNTAPPRPGTAEGARNLLSLASTCVAAEGASVLALPGPAADQCSWVEFVKAMQPSHRVALREALVFFTKQPARR